MRHMHIIDTHPRTRVARGFTLIEVLIVVAIIGILASIAYPSYGSYVQKTRRADGHLALLQEVQNMERCKATRYTFTGCTVSGSSSPEGHYTMTVTLGATGTSYTLKAEATGIQASDSDCDEMTINHQDVRTPAASVGCWPN